MGGGITGWPPATVELSPMQIKRVHVPTGTTLRMGKGPWVFVHIPADTKTLTGTPWNLVCGQYVKERFGGGTSFMGVAATWPIANAI
ncbi:hypothetical protein PILCRDRAFT_820201 [Piloderma croceum F 1598]|uniref:Uncharacterized protein n=1 Tax=Piloderma croceum (strain F 1598) TaxID=765440 RepID=A0A0C3FWQ3_PILCF|nr:hypothetical protein PILCRDRAFT_820201 [Piloderma croceum F 1598]